MGHKTRASERNEGESEIYGESERIKYVLTAFWPQGQNAEIVASGCQAGVVPFTREQTFLNPSSENTTHTHN